MFLGDSFTNAQTGNIQMSKWWMDKQIVAQWNILIYAKTWMNCEYIILKLHNAWFHLFDILKKASLYQKKTHQWVPGTRCEGRVLATQGPKGPLWGDGNVLYLNCDTGYITPSVLSKFICTSKNCIPK